MIHLRHMIEASKRPTPTKAKATAIVEGGALVIVSVCLEGAPAIRTRSVVHGVRSLEVGCGWICAAGMPRYTAPIIDLRC